MATLLALGGFAAFVVTCFLWLLLSIVVGVGASNRRRDGFGWFVLAILLSPFIAGFMLLMLGERPKPEVRDRLTAEFEEPTF